jgi:hypothetical protein
MRGRGTVLSANDHDRGGFMSDALLVTSRRRQMLRTVLTSAGRGRGRNNKVKVISGVYDLASGKISLT